MQPESVPGFPVGSSCHRFNCSNYSHAKSRSSCYCCSHNYFSRSSGSVPYSQAPFPYSEVSAAHMLNHTKTWLAQDKYTFCQVLPSYKPNLYKQKPYSRGGKNSVKKIFPCDLFFCLQKKMDLFDKSNPGTWMKVVPYHFPLRPEVLMPGSNLDSNNKKSPLGPARIF